MKAQANRMTSKDIIEQVGSEWCQETFGVKPRVVNHYGASGVLPASWYAALRARIGHDLDPGLFTFKGLDG